MNAEKAYTYNLGARFGNLTDFKNKRDVFSDIVGYMLNRVNHMIEYEGLPETLPHRSLALMLQTGGFVCIPNPEYFDGAIYAFSGCLGGVPDPYYMPTICTIANPALNFNKSLEIHKDCVIIPHDSLYRGLLPLINKYVTLLVENELSMEIAAQNSRLISFISAGDDTAARRAEETVKNIYDGKPSVCADSAFFDGIKVQPFSGESRQLTHLIEFEQYLKAGLFNELGLNANYNMKREAINTSEAQLNDDALNPLIDDILETQSNAFDELYKLFGVRITPRRGSSWKDKEAERVVNKPVESVEDDEKEKIS